MKALKALFAFLFTDGNRRKQVETKQSDYSRINTIRRTEASRQDLIDRIHIKKGCNEFTFSDGFRCIALNQKNADRKHLNWQKSNFGLA